ncbi:hypothetical protein GALL_553580 [mine drainage metagenome]|uniref:Uncharacterized protein n=1 Tax=mine drainage metagenome TaxID=410659 RepID=A0A1J5NWI0_9ZZZZ
MVKSGLTNELVGVPVVALDVVGVDATAEVGGTVVISVPFKGEYQGPVHSPPVVAGLVEPKWRGER